MSLGVSFGACMESFGDLVDTFTDFRGDRDRDRAPLGHPRLRDHPKWVVTSLSGGG